jgi:N-dimethylarginine dimethylaminohydrolase
MCPPDYYQINYEINPWMDTDRPAKVALAQEQWQKLYDSYRSFGLTVHLLEPRPGLPDLVFTANAGLVKGQTFVRSNFRFPQRQPESAVFADWFDSHGYEVLSLPDECYFEGAGDALFWGDVLLAGFGFRSSATSLPRIEQLLGVSVVTLELVDSCFYHLDTCLCPLDEKTILYYPPAFSAASLDRLQSLGANLVELGYADAHRFGCNSVRVGDRLVMNQDCRRLPGDARALGYEPVELSFSEFTKGGGNARCLTLELV